MSIEILKNKKMSKKNHEAFDKMMGYAMHTVTELVEKAKEINRNSIIALNNRDLKDNGIERD
jgi:plasmid maintenance system antidote protein VapI